MGIFSDALDALSGNWKTVALACVFPLSVSTLLDFVPAEAVGPAAVVSVALIQMLMYVCIAVAVHRIVLLGPDSVPALGVMLYLSRRELQFAGLLLLFFSLLLVSILATKVALGFSVFVFALMLYGLPVFSIVFPGTAVDSDLSLREMLAQGRHHYWLLARATLIVPLATSFVSKAFSELGARLAGVVPDLLILLAGHLGTALVLVVEIAVLSVAYARIERMESPAGVFGG